MAVDAALIEGLIAGLVERPVWTTFLERLRVALAADYVSIVFRPHAAGPERNRVVHLYAGTPSPSGLSRLYHDFLHLSDPIPYQTMPEGAVIALRELLDPADPAHRAYIDDFLTPSGMAELSMLRFAEPGGISAWLTAARAKEAFDADAAALIEGLAPYLRAALASHVALDRERVTASVATEAIRRLNFGWLTLDAEGRVLDADAQAQAVLGEGRILRRDRAGRLVARDPAVARDIAVAVQTLARERHARPRALVLSRDPWLDMLLVGAAIETGTAPRPAPAVVAYVHADGWSSADRCEQLCELFDLLPSESRLALALSRGMSMAEAAADIGLTVESARTYSKRIYAKTGARGQADLVRFIHRSVLAIA